MITSTGKGLHVVIRCHTCYGHDWLSFVTWYSLQKYLPDSTVSLVYFCEKLDRPYFHWTRKRGMIARRLGNYPVQLPYAVYHGLGQNCDTNRNHTLILTPEILCVSELTADSLSRMANVKMYQDSSADLFYIQNGSSLELGKILAEHKDWPLENFLGQPMVIPGVVTDSKSDELAEFVSCKSGWGRFVTGQWLNRLECPLPRSHVFATDDLTVNEVKVMTLWQKAAALYTTISRGDT